MSEFFTFRFLLSHQIQLREWLSPTNSQFMRRTETQLPPFQEYTIFFDLPSHRNKLQLF